MAVTHKIYKGVIIEEEDGSEAVRLTRLYRDHLIEKISEEKGVQKALFHKTGSIML